VECSEKRNGTAGMISETATISKRPFSALFSRRGGDASDLTRCVKHNSAGQAF
jgi:hypothetical protein